MKEEKTMRPIFRQPVKDDISSGGGSAGISTDNVIGDGGGGCVRDGGTTFVGDGGSGFIGDGGTQI